MQRLMTQAEFSRAMNVSQKTVSLWKKRGWCKMNGDKVDVPATVAYMRKYASSHSKTWQAPLIRLLSADGNLPSTVTQVAAVAPRAEAELPDRVADVALAIEAGAFDLAELLLRDRPLEEARAIVSLWTQKQRFGWTGGPDGTQGIAAEYWPAPPPKYAGWWSHPSFRNHAVSESEWEEAAEYAAEWRRERGLPEP